MNTPISRTLNCMVYGVKEGVDLCGYHTTILRRSRAEYESGVLSANEAKYQEWAESLRRGEINWDRSAL